MDGIENLPLYERDEYTWLHEQIAALRERRLGALDREHLIAFLEGMASRDRRELRTHMTRLLQHMLKFRVQPAKASRSWVLTVVEQQNQIRAMLHDNPGLTRHVTDEYRVAYAHAMTEAAAETGVPAARVPKANPWPTLEDALAFKAPTPPRHPSLHRRRSR